VFLGRDVDRDAAYGGSFGPLALSCVGDDPHFVNMSIMCEMAT
jgi:hypothetical protein